MHSLVFPGCLEFLRHGVGAPLWHVVATTENAVAVNAVAAVVVAICVGFVARRIAFWYEQFENPEEANPECPLPHAPLSPALAAISFLLVPQFAVMLPVLSPFLFSIVPVALSAAVVASLNSRLLPPEEASDPADASLADQRPHVLLRLATAGALAAVGAWEGPCGLAAAPLLLAMTCLPFIRRERSTTSVCFVWTVAFASAFLLELLLPTCSWQSLASSVRQPLRGWAVFALVGVMPLAVVRRIGENRRTLGVWVLALVGLAVYAGLHVRFNQTSASERFVRFVLGELGSRKYVVGDGIFDVMIDEFKPAEVRRLGVASVAEREFLLTGLGEGPISNHVLAVRSCYGRYPDMAAVAAEVGGRYYRQDAAQAEANGAHARRQSEVALREAFQALAKRRSGNLSAKQRAKEDEDISMEIRQGWRNGFAGWGLSSTLLSLDMMAGNRDNLESDAVMALMVDPDDPAANAVLGSLRLAEGREDLAERYLEKGVKGGGILAMRDYARLLLSRGRDVEALDWARKAAERAPNDCEVRKTLAAALIETGDFKAAREELDGLLKLDARQKGVANAKLFVHNALRRLQQKEKGAER